MSTNLVVGDEVRLLTDGGYVGTFVKGDVSRVTEVGHTIVVLENGLSYFHGTDDRTDEVEKVEEVLADWEKELLAEGRKFRVGDHVEIVKGTYACTSSQIGMRGVVSYVDTTSVSVEVKGGANYIHRPEGLKLIEAKQEEPEVKQGLKAGDKVRVINGSRWHKQGESGKIAAVDRWGNLELNGWWISPKEVELVTGKPKARSQEIELEDVQKGDLIVCFWNGGGVETRQKGRVHGYDTDNWPITEEGSYVAHDLDYEPAAHIYLIERPEYKEPAKPEDGLDKTLTYVVKAKNSYTGTYYLKFVADAWRFRYEDVVVRESSSTVGGVEADLIEGKTSWEKPVPYEPSDLEKYTEAGYVGNIYVRPSNTPYKVTDEGKVMAWYKDTDKWTDISWDFETFHSSMQAGAFTKIS